LNDNRGKSDSVVTLTMHTLWGKMETKYRPISRRVKMIVVCISFTNNLTKDFNFIHNAALVLLTLFFTEELRSSSITSDLEICFLEKDLTLQECIWHLTYVAPNWFFAEKSSRIFLGGFLLVADLVGGDFGALQHN
jgi:hypothetical protein